MGTAIYVPGVDWSANGLGKVTLSNTKIVSGITVVGDAAVLNRATYKVMLSPVFTTQRDVVWSITSGSQYASINSNGEVTALPGASASSVTIRATSVANSSVYGEKTISVTSGEVVYYDYLQSDGNCYYLVDGLSSFMGGKLILRTTLNTANGYAFGSQYDSSATTTRFGVYKRNAGDVGIAVAGNYNGTLVTADSSKIYRVEFNLSTTGSSGDGSAVLYDDSTNTQLWAKTDIRSYVNADFVFFNYGANTAGAGSTFQPGDGTYSANKLYGFQAIDSEDSVVRNVVPITIGGTPALLETVQGKICYNLGTGTPTVGND